MLIGNAVVGQSGGPTAAINATLSGALQILLCGIKDIMLQFLTINMKIILAVLILTIGVNGIETNV